MDHHRDLVEELRASGCDEARAEEEAALRLGDPRQLLQKTVRAYQQRYWCGRWPKLAFLLLPIAAMYGLWISTVLILQGVIILLNTTGIAHLGEPATGEMSHSQRAIVFGSLAWCLLVLPALSTWVFARLAKRARLGLRWFAFAACVLALTAGSVRFYPGERYKSAADALTRTAPTPTYWLDVMPFGNAAFWLHPARSLYRTYTIGIFQPYQTLLPIATMTFLLLRSRRFATTTEWQPAIN
jgi:hypothetical protein